MMQSIVTVLVFGKLGVNFEQNTKVYVYIEVKPQALERGCGDPILLPLEELMSYLVKLWEEI